MRRFSIALVTLFTCCSQLAFTDDQPPNAGAKSTTPKFHVVGYLPEYRIADIDVEVGQYLSDLVCFSARAGPEGDLNLKGIKPEHIQKLTAIKERHPVALLLCVGGWNRSGGFPELAASPAAREKFTAALVEFCRANQFDGVDLDWEHPASETEYRDYATLLAETRKAFEPRHLQLTIAVAGWQVLPAEAIQAADRIHLMAYDAEGKHSTCEFAEADVGRLIKHGVPPGKICLGLPFYGRDVKDRSRELTYSQIVKKFEPDADVDEVDGVYFNGATTIERKTKFALAAKLGGVMAWEIGQDATGERSLLRAIKRATGAGATRP
jgi:chitinase